MKPNLRRVGNYLEAEIKFLPWYTRLWYWIRRKPLTTSGTVSYIFEIPEGVVINTED